MLSRQDSDQNYFFVLVDMDDLCALCGDEEDRAISTPIAWVSVCVLKMLIGYHVLY